MQLKKASEMVDAKPPPFEGAEIRSITLDKHGGTISEKWGKQQTPNPLPDFQGFELEAATTNPNGGAWLKYKLPKGQLPQLEDLRSLLAELSTTDFIKKDWTPLQKDGTTQVLSLGDIHIGMDSKDNVFGHKWDKDRAIERASSIGAYVDKKAAKVVVIIGGDLNDGQDGKTTRKGHDLPQNLDSREQIRQSGIFCLSILDSVTQATNAEIEVVFLVNSNHGGGVMDFAVGLMLQHCVPFRYSNQVTFHLQEQFIGAYKFGGVDFLVTHGYDEKHMPRGLPRFLSKDNITFFERVIEHHKLSAPYLWRYDQHQHHVIEYPKFKDIMTKAFSTPSSWVSLNFSANDLGGFINATITDTGISIQSVNFES